MSLPLNIRVYTFCYNLELILPFIIEYWKLYATSVVVYDNMSTDKSVDILSKYDWIEVRQFDTNGQHNPEKVQDIKNKCVSEIHLTDIDYAMICDLDEVLYCYDSLMIDLLAAKNAGVKVFTSVYYNAVSNKVPAVSSTLLLNTSGVKLAKNTSVNKVLLFDPSIDISFSNLLHSCSYDSKLKSTLINVIHAKMIGVDRFVNEQLDFVSRINKVNRTALSYGSNRNACISIFNNVYAKTFLPLYRTVNPRIILSKISGKPLSVISNVLTARKANEPNLSFTDIKWTNSSIVYNTPACGNKDLIIAVPVYKENLDEFEQRSLVKLVNTIKTSYDIVLVTPDGLNIEKYNNLCNRKLNVLKLNKAYFANRKTYSFMCETVLFYECFSAYKYMMIYQLDGWIFKNDLNRFIQMNYDYIGAPWKQSLAIPRAVGNGGVSLRKVSKFIELCKDINPKDITEKHAAQIEDLFFCLYIKGKMKDKFNIAPVNIGLEFCIDKNPSYWMVESKGKLPMCIHALPKNYYYWENKITVDKPVVKNTVNNAPEVKVIENKNKININFVNTANVNDDTLLVSMTSYPARINYAVIAFKSILRLNINRKCHCILVLAEPEFPNKSKNLPAELNELIQKGLIEIIWYPKNIMSHKKLMPTLKKYPNNDILIIDDDIEREQGWLQTFINDNRKHPSDIICGTFFWYYQPDFTMKRFDDAKGVNCGGKNNITDIVFNFSRPANGAGGVLYPKHTFMDPRFFDENLYQKYSPTSDESWQFMFNMIENRTLRQLSVLYDQSKYVIGDSQRMSTALYKKNKYNEINERLFKAFPEYKDAILKRMNNIIVSVTSYKNRLPYLKDVLLSILNGTMKPYKIVITLCQEDVKYITDELQSIIDKNNIEILIAEKDIKPHKKYYYIMKKYPANPIVTIDDDIVYTPDLIESLYKSYVNYPNAISARRTHKIRWDARGNVLPYKKWVFEQKTVTEKSFELFATTGAGTLFPPGILNVDSIKMEDIDKCINADDVFLKYIANTRNVKVVWVKNTKMMGLKELRQAEVQENALYKTNCHGGNDYYLKIFKIEKK